MKKHIPSNIILLLFLTLFGMASCSKDDIEGQFPPETGQTVFLYMPWSTNLTSYFQQNIADFETAIRGNILKNNRLVVFLSSSATEASMFELKYEKGQNVRIPLKEYSDPKFTEADGITAILNDVMCFAPANRYAMIIGCHGMGWLPVQSGRARGAYNDCDKDYWEYEGVPLTRYFGGTTSDVQTEITELAKGIANTGIKMDYILFDDCYMSSIEVAYDLKDVSDYLIASPTEVMAYGFPYHIIGEYLIGDFNLQGIVDGFYDYYANYQYPYGTIAVTVCGELDNMAAIMRDINQQSSFNTILLDNVQRMDGYSPVIFFDFGDYVNNLCTDETLLKKFEYQLERTVPSNLSLHTHSYFSMIGGAIKIDAYTGVTISDPSINSKTVEKTETAWYKATHL